MPRPKHFSIDLPSAKQSIDYGDRDSGIGSEFELEDYDALQRTMSGAATQRASEAPASWRTIPHKGQLAILFLSRFADFFQVACLQAIMFHQLRSFDAKAADSTISWQAGLLQGSFMATQSISAILWGRVADAPWGGRKKVLLAGFMGTGITSVGVAFSGSFGVAMLWRLLAGMLNGTIGTTRTMVAETVERKFHSRAFMLLPLAYNFANIFAPLLGAVMVDPFSSFPTIFGPKSVLGGEKGMTWMKNYPYAPPNLLSALVMLVQAMVIYLGLVETLASRRYARDVGVELAHKIRRKIPFVRRRRTHYTRLSVNDALIFDAASSPVKENFTGSEDMHPQQVLPFQQIFTSNVVWTMICMALLHFHVGAFSTIWPTFLSTSRNHSEAAIAQQNLPFVFTGGLSFAPTTVAITMAFVGAIGVLLQLSLYPRVDEKLGVASTFRWAVILFPVSYMLTPYLALIPADYGFQLWLVIGTVLLLEVTGHTFALPGSIILTNNSTPHPSVLGTIHGVGMSTAAISKTLGNFLGGTWFAIGLEKGVVGTAWWAVAVVGVLGWISSFWVRNGTGHEILLPEEDLPNDELLQTPDIGRGHRRSRSWKNIEP
jgi:hypothetical protein